MTESTAVSRPSAISTSPTRAQRPPIHTCPGTTPTQEPAPCLVVAIPRPARGRLYRCNVEVTSIGRHPNTDIRLIHPSVSRWHAELRVDGDGAFIHDTLSLNGTFLNGRRLEEAPLRDGDQVQIGTFTLIYRASLKTFHARDA